MGVRRRITRKGGSYVIRHRPFPFSLSAMDDCKDGSDVTRLRAAAKRMTMSIVLKSSAIQGKMARRTSTKGNQCLGEYR